MNDNNYLEEVTTKCFIAMMVVFSLVILLIACIASIIIYKQQNENKNVNTTIEYVDSIKKENDKLIIEVNNLDSLKNAKIIEVTSLDNDSTVKLFYKLIRE